MVFLLPGARVPLVLRKQSDGYCLDKLMCMESCMRRLSIEATAI